MKEIGSQIIDNSIFLVGHVILNFKKVCFLSSQSSGFDMCALLQLKNMDVKINKADVAVENLKICFL